MIGTIIFACLALTFVDGTESLATIHAVDQIDPYRRKSNPHRTLLAMGVSNICSSMIGGLTIIPGIIKSTTCIVAGGRTAWVNFYNALFLALFLLLASAMLKMIPIAALAAVLLHIGYKLAGPQKWKSLRDLGWEQFAVFSITVFVTVSTDLLVGIAAGIATKILILWIFNGRAPHPAEAGANSGLSVMLSDLVRIFRTPVTRVEVNDSTAHVYLAGPVTCFNNLQLRAAVDRAAEKAQEVRIHVTDEVTVLDHSSVSYLKILKDRSGVEGVEFSVEGEDSLVGRSRDQLCLRYRVQV